MQEAIAAPDSVREAREAIDGLLIGTTLLPRVVHRPAPEINYTERQLRTHYPLEPTNKFQGWENQAIAATKNLMLNKDGKPGGHMMTFGYLGTKPAEGIISGEAPDGTSWEIRLLHPETGEQQIQLGLLVPTRQ
jgi:hypothetical protein